MAIPYPDLNNGTGVVPMTVEPLHQWEKTGLSSLANPGLLGDGSMVKANQMLQEMNANPAAFAAKYTNPKATEYLDKAGQYTADATKGISMDEIMDVSNPFSSAVKNRLSEAGQKARAAVMANQGMRGARSFGDTSQGVRLGEIDKELLSKGADVDYSSFNDARTLLNQMRDRTLSAGGQFSNIAGQAQDVTNSAAGTGMAGIAQMYNSGQGLTQQGMENIKNQIGAGNYIRTYNQGVSDLIGSDMQAEIADPASKMSQVLSWLQQFQSQTGGATPGANTMETIGGVGTIAGGLLDRFSGTAVGGTAGAIPAARAAGNAARITF